MTRPPLHGVVSTVMGFREHLPLEDMNKRAESAVDRLRLHLALVMLDGPPALRGQGLAVGGVF
jgi:hypothetical protein